jgi:hypothetical protein
MHYPPNAKQRSHEAAEAVDSIPQPFFICALGDQPENDTGEQRKDQRHLKVRESDGHPI